MADTHRGHGDDDPVEGIGDGGVLCVFLLPLDKVGEAGEQEAEDADEEDQEAELLVAVLQGIRYWLKSGWVAGQLQDPDF